MILGLGAVALVAMGCATRPQVNNRMRPHKLGHYPGDGGVLIGKNGKICLAPPVQAVKTVKLEVTNSAKAKVTEVVDAELASKIGRDESLHSLYEQGQATLFLQFMAYRLCEANLAGLVKDEVYAAKLDEINARGERLLSLELELASERTKTAEAEADKTKAVVESFRKSVELLGDPGVDAATKAGVLKLSTTRASTAEAEAEKAKAEAAKVEAMVETYRDWMKLLQDPEVDAAVKESLKMKLFQDPEVDSAVKENLKESDPESMMPAPK